MYNLTWDDFKSILPVARGRKLDTSNPPKGFMFVKYINQWFLVPNGTVYIACERVNHNKDFRVCVFPSMPYFAKACCASYEGMDTNPHWYSKGISDLPYALAWPVHLAHNQLKPENSLRVVQGNGKKCKRLENVS